GAGRAGTSAASSPSARSGAEPATTPPAWSKRANDVPWKTTAPAGNTPCTTSSKLKDPWTSTDSAPLELAKASTAAVGRSGEVPPARADGRPARSSSPSSATSARMLFRRGRSFANRVPGRVVTSSLGLFRDPGLRTQGFPPDGARVATRVSPCSLEPVFLYAVAQRIARDGEQ